jgi:predicted membrane protein
MIEFTASLYHSLTVLASAVVFVAGMVLIPYGIGFALLAVLLTVLGMTYAKKLEEEFFVHDTKEGGKDG